MGLACVSQHQHDECQPRHAADTLGFPKVLDTLNLFNVQTSN